MKGYLFYSWVLEFDCCSFALSGEGASVPAEFVGAEYFV